MEIKVNDYVRTKNGKIRKITEEYQFNKYGKFWFLIKENNKIENYNEYFIDTINEKEIVKHSNNIIDLIEKNDYVNGKLVSNVDEIDNKTIIEWEDGDMYSPEIENDSFIKSIVTHEQFSSLEYII